MSNSAPSKEEVTAIREASIWYARLASDIVCEDDHKQWLSWHSSSSLNQHAWQTVEAVRQQLERVPKNIAIPAIAAAKLSRRNMLRNMVVLLTTGSAAWASYRVMPWSDWSADYRTATGERREVILADGSQLFINTSSSLDIVFDAHHRLIKLHAGEVLIRTATDPQVVSRPFMVETRHGEVLALGTKFSVKTNNEASAVSVLEKSVRIQPNQTHQNIILSMGQQIQFDAHGFDAVQRYDPLATSWTSGSLAVIDMPLGELIEELSRYRPGFLMCSPQIASLKVSGTFPIDNTDRALAALAHGYHLNIISRTRYWTKLEPA